QEMFRAIEMRAKPHSVVGDLAEFRETEYLVAARIGEDRSSPGHEFVQTAKLADQLMPRPQIEMIGVGKNDFGAQLFERLLPQSFDARRGANRQKEWRLNHAVRCGQPPAPGTRRIGLGYLKGKVHFASVARCASHRGDADPTGQIEQP